MKKLNLKELDTYVYIDSSNIRNALKMSNRRMDWKMLFDYLSSTYKNLLSTKYFEGIDKNDNVKLNEFKVIETYGYELKTLGRKAYINSAKYKTFKCINCKEKNTVEILKESKTLKSNIDVYLCSELMGELINISKESHAIILTCDGDYAEMIRNLLKKNKNIHISVFATPFSKTNNYLSVRLKELERIDRYYLVNIMNIKDRISTKNRR
ncbi:MAG: NYN domain-containing protein [bacterium]